MAITQTSVVLIVGVAAFAAGSTLAVAQGKNSPLMKSFGDNWTSGSSNGFGQLASNEGIYVDVKDFKIMKGQARGDPSAEITKLGGTKFWTAPSYSVLGMHST